MGETIAGALGFSRLLAHSRRPLHVVRARTQSTSAPAVSGCSGRRIVRMIRDDRVAEISLTHRPSPSLPFVATCLGDNHVMVSSASAYDGAFPTAPRVLEDERSVFAGERGASD